MSPVPLHLNGAEDELDQSPQPSKRRKLTPGPTPPTSRSLTQAPFGKSTSSPKTILKPNKRPTRPTVNGSPHSARNGLTSPWLDEPDELGEDEDTASITTPIKTPLLPSQRKKATKVQVVTGAGTVGSTTKASEPALSSAGKRSRKHKGWQYLKEDEHVGINNQDAFAKIAEDAAKEAANAASAEPNASLASTKGVRERKSRVWDDTPVRSQGTKIGSTKTSTRNKGESSSKKKVRSQERGGDLTMPRPLERSASLDELQDGPSAGQETGAGNLQTPKKDHAGFKRSDQLSESNVKGNITPCDRPPPPKDLDRLSFSTGKVASNRNSSKQSATLETADPAAILDLHPETLLESSQQELSGAAAHLRNVLSDHPNGLTIIKQSVILQLTGKSLFPVLQHHAKDYEAVHQLLSQTVQAGEGNSIILTGSRGTGKSMLVETVISDLLQSNGEDFYVVRLNGFIHTDDKLALREIWRQLGRELDGDDEEPGLRNNYADTLTSLLALLSHQEEGSQEGGEERQSAAKSVIFVLDEFDLFAQHPRQTLLYNLFEVAQSHRNAPIAVLGLTTKVDVISNLEKRVKSRFSQRSVHVSLPKSFQVFQDVCLESFKYRSPPIAQYSTFQARLQHDGATSELNIAHIPEDLIDAWNDYARALLSTEHLTELQHSYYVTSKRPSDFQTAIALPLLYALNISNLSSIISTSPPSYYPTWVAPDSVLALLPSLSTLQLTLLIAACRLEIILSTDLCSFDMAYEEYLVLAKKAKTSFQHASSGQLTGTNNSSSSSGGGGGGGIVRSHHVAKGAWQGLEDVGFLVPAGTAGGGGNYSAAASGDRDGGRWRVDVSLEEIGVWLTDGEGRAAVAGSQGLGKWCREL